MSQKETTTRFNFLRRFWKIVKTLFLAYAVVFSLVVTALIISAYIFISRPIREVRELKVNNPTETAFMAQHSERLSHNPASSIDQEFVPITQISPWLKKAVLAAEDDGFFTHPGFDLDAIIAAFDYNRTQGENIRGASTITQQLAKNLFLSPERSFRRKAIELGYTLLLEHYLSKDRILELYLNYAQWGVAIFGCEAASWYYFNKPSYELTLYEAARMAAVLSMPSRLTPHHITSPYMQSRLTVIANNLYYRGSIDKEQYMMLTENEPPEIVEQNTGVE
ncbi:monofunctional biosynthetic peptidoglycan transglycosylase [Chitinispirillales bacterium ANBcel5]|uniref:monofunctional biosynthetic peptidoglycan transglycosylase n=1 Tax=Cellulosispirillum alkaliphilum TaxID=3039283 RepID=UPI002A56E930|nr:monofunctional biosynthetic peptidoglycan transglycosylase [Chitinispirillales bacterium ANBcel5]